MNKMDHQAKLRRLQNALQQSAQVQTELDRRVFYLKTLYDVSKDIFCSVESEKILRSFLLMAMGNFGVSKGFILTLNSPSQAIQHFVAVGFEQEDETHLKTGAQQLAEQGLLLRFAADKIDFGREDFLPATLNVIRSFVVEADCPGIFGLGAKLTGEPYIPVANRTLSLPENAGTTA